MCGADGTCIRFGAGAPSSAGVPIPQSAAYYDVSAGFKLYIFFNGVWQAATAASGPGSGDVVGPAAATNNNFAAFNGITGKIIKDSGSSAASFDAAGAAAAALVAAEAYTDAHAGPTTVIQAINSGAAPIDIALPAGNQWQILIVNVTSGGTGGIEIVNLPAATDSQAGRVVIVNLVAQTDPSDAVHVTSAGGVSIPAIAAGTSVGSLQGDYSLLDFLGAYSFLQWLPPKWVAILGNYGDDSTVVPFNSFVPPGGTTGQALTKVDNTNGFTQWTDVATGTQGAKADTALQSTNGVITGSTTVENVWTVDFTAAFGAIAALTGTEVTQAITGLLTTDQVHVECVSAPPSGYIPPNARVSAADTLALRFTTAVALGITLGALNFRLTVIR